MNDINQQRYADKIRRQYAEHETTKMDRLRELDRKVKLPAQIFACIFGVVGALVLGAGMCLAMKVIGDMMAFGIVLGVVGIGIAVANYFIYSAILKARKRKYAEQVIALSDELLNK